jgi:hypothetical protein
MKQHFDRNGHRLTDTERESIWRAIDEARETPRRRAFPRPAWGIALAAALSVIVAVGIWQRGGPEDPRRMVTPAVEEALVDEVAPMREEALADEKKHLAAVPAGPEETPTVASSEMARRAPAAAAMKGAATPPAATAGEAADEVVAAPPAGEAAKGAMTFEVSRKLGAQAGHGCITGRVTDAETGEPLSFANVIVEGTNWGAMSLEDGSFTICLPPGAYTLRVTYMGYEAVEVAALVEQPGAMEVLHVAMNPGIAAELPMMVVEGTKPNVDVKSSEVKTHKRQEDLSTFAVDNVQEAMALEAGITVRGGDLYVRGGAADEEARDRLRPGTWIERPRRRCWWPPEIRPPHGEPYADMFFQHYGVNPFIATEDDALSTFAVDVDNASYTLARGYVERGHLPPREAVRVEEFVNFFDPDWPRVTEGDFALRADGMPSPHGEGYHLLRVGIQGRTVDDDERMPANLIFVIDTSGSMAREDRLTLVKRALMVLMGELREGDTVGIVEYGSRGRIVLQPTGSSEPSWPCRPAAAPTPRRASSWAT